ncbi:MAG: sulfatase, partial [Burkholderiales bacterium]
MLGSDTLRADRLGASGYYRSLTPRIDALARSGTLFTHCFVPCARTAPSLISMLTGCWPNRYGVRDNYVASAETNLSVPCLPALLRDAGYKTIALGDWAAGDLKKFNLGFDAAHTPDDQWNIKYLLRQGPKDLRLFLSLFLSNPLGRKLLPEIYYLAGVPRTRQLGIQVRRALSGLAQAKQPFLLTMFAASTHPPFGSEYPYYRMFSDPGYRGDSLFAMARLTDPFDIIRRQGEARSEFDLDQIEDLYDGCVRAFDDEVRRVLAHLELCGLGKNTIVVVFSDHGMEFFEHGTWGQGNSIFGDHSARTPLIIADPRSPPNATVSKVIRNIDIAPTLLELALGTRTDAMDGISLAETIRAGNVPPHLLARTETGIWLTHLPGTPAG